MTITHNAHQASFDVIIVGGSYSGLSAAMALGRSLRRVLVIDSGKPCNRQTPHSHNFITHDGETPEEISNLARRQVEKYETVQIFQGLAMKGMRTEAGFWIETQEGKIFDARKLIITSGVRDIMPDIPGFAECWGISVIHCPYCHGYEVRNEATGILADGDAALHLTPMVNNLTRQLIIFTNGEATFSEEQHQKLERHGIKVIEKEVEKIEHINGQLKHLIFKDSSSSPLKALYARVPFVQHSIIPEMLGCELTEFGLLKTDAFQQTSIPGVFAAGDCATLMRSVASAVATGNLAGAMANKQLCEEDF